MVGHGGSSAGSYLADPTSPIPSHCASIVVTGTIRVNWLEIWHPMAHITGQCVNKDLWFWTHKQGFSTIWLQRIYPNLHHGYCWLYCHFCLHMISCSCGTAWDACRERYARYAAAQVVHLVPFSLSGVFSITIWVITDEHGPLTHWTDYI